MTWIIANWRLVIGCVLAGLLCTISAYGGYFYEHAKWNEEKLRVQADALTAMETHADMIRKADEQYDKDQSVITGLRVERDKLRNTVHFPTICQNSDEASGVLSNRVDELFEGFQERAGRLIEEADELNRQAIRLNTECTTNPATLPRQPPKEAGSWLQ